MSNEAMPTTTINTGLQPPTSPARVAGSANTDAPITWLTPMAVRSHRPSSRRRAGRDSARIGSCTQGTVHRLYHDSRGGAGRGVRGARRWRVARNFMDERSVVVKPRDVMPEGART